jgi:hypothetical protein
LNIRVKNISEDNLLDLFVGTLKKRIQHEVCLLDPKSIENDFSVKRKVGSKYMATRRVSTNAYREGNIPTHNLTQTTRLTPQQLDKRREKDYYVSIVTTSIVRVISVVRRNYST